MGMVLEEALYNIGKWQQIFEKKCLNSIVTTEMQRKTTLRYHFTLSKMTKTQSQQVNTRIWDSGVTMCNAT